MRVINVIQRLMASSSGFALLEVSIAVAILTMGIGLVGTTVFETLTIQRYWGDDAIATRDTRHAGSWFARDALTARATSLVDNDPAVNSVTLTLESSSITYALSGTTLMRQTGGAQNAVAENVVSVGFSRSGKDLTFALEVDASRGGTETLSLQNHLRFLQ